MSSRTTRLIMWCTLRRPCPGHQGVISRPIISILLLEGMVLIQIYKGVVWGLLIRRTRNLSLLQAIKTHGPTVKHITITGSIGSTTPNPLPPGLSSKSIDQDSWAGVCIICSTFFLCFVSLRVD